LAQLKLSQSAQVAMVLLVKQRIHQMVPQVRPERQHRLDQILLQMEPQAAAAAAMPLELAEVECFKATVADQQAFPVRVA
jgi:hypothetical protein